jgi:hypothetical protein
MVAAVRCPNPKCRKFMLVEETDQGKVVPCLICKQPIKVPQTKTAPTPPAPFGLESTADLTPIFEDDEPQFKMD